MPHFSAYYHIIGFSSVCLPPCRVLQLSSRLRQPYTIFRFSSRLYRHATPTGCLWEVAFLPPEALSFWEGCHASEGPSSSFPPLPSSTACQAGMPRRRHTAWEISLSRRA